MIFIAQSAYSILLNDGVCAATDSLKWCVQDPRCCLLMTSSLSGWLGPPPLAAVTRLPRPQRWTEHTVMALLPRPALPALHTLLAGIPAPLKVSSGPLVAGHEYQHDIQTLNPTSMTSCHATPHAMPCDAMLTFFLNLLQLTLVCRLLTKVSAACQSCIANQHAAQPACKPTASASPRRLHQLLPKQLSTKNAHQLSLQTFIHGRTGAAPSLFLQAKHGNGDS